MLRSRLKSNRDSILPTIENKKLSWCWQTCATRL